MCHIHFIVPVGADQQQVSDIRLGEQVLDQVQRRGVEPLQVVEKEGQGMLRPREHVDESTEYQVESALGVLRRKVRNRWLLSDDRLQFRNQTHHQLSVGIQRLTK